MSTRSSKDLAESSEVMAENEGKRTWAIQHALSSTLLLCQELISDQGTFTWPEYCTQKQIRYTCGHTIGGEFIKCHKHIPRDDDRCAGINIQYVEVKLSPHKCRNCLHTPDR